MKLLDYNIDNPHMATLIATERITPKTVAEVRHMMFEMPEDGLDFVEGQSVGVLVPGPHDFGNTHHLRLYSIASSRGGDGGSRNTFSICVRRCYYIDEISGERYPGKASNYLCNALPGQKVSITGPYGSHFQVPQDDTTNLLMVGVGTGIAPFRAFTRHIYDERGGWSGKVRLFYGAKTGMEMLYMNDFKRDISMYYTHESFKAFEAVSPRPAFDLPSTLDRMLISNQLEVWEMMEDPNTYVYVAGLVEASQKFEKAMTVMVGSKDGWLKKRAEMEQQGRYAELLY